jgi:hypothetical protein
MRARQSPLESHLLPDYPFRRDVSAPMLQYGNGQPESGMHRPSMTTPGRLIHFFLARFCNRRIRVPASPHQDLRAAGRATKIHISDSLYAWGLVPADERRSSDHGGPGGGPGTGEDTRLWHRRTTGPADDRADKGLGRRRTGPKELHATHGGGTGGGPGTTRGGIGGGPRPADIRVKGVRGRSHGTAAERSELGLGEPKSTLFRTGTICRAASLACSDWSGERDVGRSRVEGGGDYGEPGPSGRRPRLAVAGASAQSAVTALGITLRDI